MSRIRDAKFWARELELLASARDGEAQDRWLKLMNALGFAPRKQSGGTQRAGYLDVVAVVREKKWKTEDNPLAYIARTAERLHHEGDHGSRRGIVTAKGAHGGVRDPYRETYTPVGEEAARLRLGIALEKRLESAPDDLSLVDRFIPEYKIKYELSPEDRARLDEYNQNDGAWYGSSFDCEGPLRPGESIDFEKIALEEGFDELSRCVLLYRVRGVSREKALAMEKERHGECTRLAVSAAWRDIDRHGEWDAFRRAIKRKLQPASFFESAVESKAVAARRRRNEGRGLLSLEQVAKQLRLKVSELDGFIRSRKLQPVDGLIPYRFHPYACDRFVKEHLLRKVEVIDDSATNLAARTRAGIGQTGIVPWDWPAWVTPPVPTCKGKNKGPKK